MRQILILSILYFFTLSATSQVNPKKGYIITHAGDTIHGTIDYRTDTRNCQECLFRAEGAEKFVSYHPDDILGYRFANDGVYYVSRTFPVEGTDTKMFAEYIIQGGVSLFFYKNHGLNYYFFVDENGQVAPMKEPNLDGLSTEEEKEVKRASMLQASQLLSKSPDATEALWKSNFDRQALTLLTRQYDEKYCSQWGDCVQFQYDEQSIRTAAIKGFRIEAGMLMGSSRCEGVGHNGMDYENIHEQLTLTSPRIMAGIDIVFPRLSRSLIAQLLIGYTYVNAKKSNTKRVFKDGHDQEIDLKYHANSLSMEVGAAYSFMPDRKVSPIVRAGVNIDYLFGFHTENLEKYYVYEKEETNSHGLLIGYYIGAGVDFSMGKHTWSLTAQLNRNGRFSSNGGIKYLAPEVRLGFVF